MPASCRGVVMLKLIRRSEYEALTHKPGKRFLLVVIVDLCL